MKHFVDQENRSVQKESHIHHQSLVNLSKFKEVITMANIIKNCLEVECPIVSRNIAGIGKVRTLDKWVVT